MYYNDPGFPIMYCIPDLGFVLVVVVYILFPSFKSLVFEFWDVLGEFGTGWL